MYIDLKINDVPAKFLVDTGATISLVSNKIFYALDKSEPPLCIRHIYFSKKKA
jgi:hypothetical protein